MERDQQADAALRKLLDGIPFGDLATRRLNFLLELAHTTLVIFHRRRMLSWCRDTLARMENS